MGGLAREELVFVGSYAPVDAPGIYAFTIDEPRSRVRLLASFDGIENPSFLLVHPGGSYLFAVSETGVESSGIEGSVHAFRIDRDAGAVDLIALNRRSTGGDHPCHLSVDGDGRWLAVSNYGTGSVAVFPIERDGSLGEMAASVRHEGAGPNVIRQRGPHAHSAIFAPDNQFVIVADLGIDQLVVYSFDTDSGALVHHDQVATAPGAGPRHACFHPLGDRLFVVNELDNTITLYHYEIGVGVLRPIQTLSTLPSGVSDGIAAALRINRSGNRVYVSNRGHDSVAVYEFDTAAGMTLLADRPCGGAWPRDLGLVAGDSHLLVANQRSGTIVLLPVRAGGPNVPVAGAELQQPSCIAPTG